jgi:cation diffusion facilitator family transporter
MKSAEKRSVVVKLTWVSVGVNLLLAFIKILFGYLGKSQAAVADGIHSLTDLVSDGVILVGVKYWDMPADENHPHGHKKIETMVTLIIGLILAMVGGGIFYNSIFTINEVTGPPAWPVFFATLISILVKEGIFRWTIRVGKRIKSMPLIANAWHHRSDALSSLPATIAILLTILFPQYLFFDKIGAIIVSGFIFYAAFEIIRPSFNKLIDSGVSDKELDIIAQVVKETPGVLNVHDIRTRYIGSTSIAIDCHIIVNPQLTILQAFMISEHVKKRLFDSKLEVVDVIIHVEPAI